MIKLLLSEFKEWFNQQDPNEKAIVDNDQVCKTCLIARFIQFKTGKPASVGYNSYDLVGEEDTTCTKLPNWARSVTHKINPFHRNDDLRQFVNDLTE